MTGMRKRVNRGIRTALQTMKVPLMLHSRKPTVEERDHNDDKIDDANEEEEEEEEEEEHHWQEDEEELESKHVNFIKAHSLPLSRRETRISLQIDVYKLKKMLKQEEAVRRAFEQALSGHLSAASLCRLTHRLPHHETELLMEVASLEEEVVLLQEQLLGLRQDLYQEAIDQMSLPKTILMDGEQAWINIDQPETSTSSSDDVIININIPISKARSSKERQLQLDDINDHGHCENGECVEEEEEELTEAATGSGCGLHHYHPWRRLATMSSDECNIFLGGGSPNAISESIVTCLMGIFMAIGGSRPYDHRDDYDSNNDGTLIKAAAGDPVPVLNIVRDPYEMCHMRFKRRRRRSRRRDNDMIDHNETTPFLSIDNHSINTCSVNPMSLPLFHHLKVLLRKLAFVDLRGLSHQKRLAFWINVYNSCMMNAFLEHGIPDCPKSVATMMRKATINAGGNVLNALTIEHLILRHPSNLNQDAFPTDVGDVNIAAARSVPGLDKAEPLVSFALSCGSWSSPPVRVYNACEVETQLKTATREFLQAALTKEIVKNKRQVMIMIPKLLDWYLTDFAHDLESLVEWIYLQLSTFPNKRSSSIVNIDNNGDDHEPSARSDLSEAVHVMPYDFRFRYLFST